MFNEYASHANQCANYYNVIRKEEINLQQAKTSEFKQKWLDVSGAYSSASTQSLNTNTAPQATTPNAGGSANSAMLTVNSTNSYNSHMMMQHQQQQHQHQQSYQMHNRPMNVLPTQPASNSTNPSPGPHHSYYNHQQQTPQQHPSMNYYEQHQMQNQHHQMQKHLHPGNHGQHHLQHQQQHPSAAKNANFYDVILVLIFQILIIRRILSESWVEIAENSSKSEK